MRINLKYMNAKFLIIIFMFPVLVFAAQKYPEVRTKKFESGKTQEITKYVGYNDIEESESFFANGKKKISYHRTNKSKDPFEPDLYKMTEWNDSGNIIAEGTCLVLPSRDFYPNESCWTLTGVTKRYDEDGKLIEERNEVKGKAEGITTTWTAEKIVKITFKNGLKTKEETLDPKTEKVIKTVEFLEDGSRK